MSVNVHSVNGPSFDDDVVVSMAHTVASSARRRRSALSNDDSLKRRSTTVAMHSWLSKTSPKYLRLSVCPLAAELHLIFCTLPVAMAQSSSDGVAIRYVLPVFIMTLHFIP